MMTSDEFYIVVDIETSGPDPCKYAMLSFGACTISKPQETLYIEMKPDSDQFIPEALEISALSLKELRDTGTPPSEGMQTFADWLAGINKDKKTPVFTAFNAPFDWMFVNTYFHRYLGYNPFGYKALDIKACYMGLHHTSFDKTSHKDLCEYYQIGLDLTHHALEDAINEAEIFRAILQEMKTIPTEGGTK
jgi:DNA polymerase III epsilon subunit-like protein